METVAEFLARGGKIETVKAGKVDKSLNFRKSGAGHSEYMMGRKKKMHTESARNVERRNNIETFVGA